MTAVFIERFPFALRDMHFQRDASGWYIGDSSSQALPIAPQFARPWELLAFYGGRPIDVFAEWDGAFLHPLAVAGGNDLSSRPHARAASRQITTAANWTPS